jgi:hypothetical protein
MESVSVFVRTADIDLLHQFDDTFGAFYRSQNETASLKTESDSDKTMFRFLTLDVIVLPSIHLTLPPDERLSKFHGCRKDIGNQGFPKSALLLPWTMPYFAGTV